MQALQNACSVTNFPDCNIDLELRVTGVRSSLGLDGGKTIMLLHWGSMDDKGTWSQLPVLPHNAFSAGNGFAMKTYLDKEGRAVLSLPLCDIPNKIAFVLYVTSEGWENWLRAEGGSNFVIDVEDALNQENCAYQVDVSNTSVSSVP